MGLPDISQYSSSSDSESEMIANTPRRRTMRRSLATPPGCTVPSTKSTVTTTTTDDKKKKKNRKPPQENINSIWKKFSQKKFSKALSVLPFAPVPASTSSERGNELLQAGYERAAEECRRKVRKIIIECKRINTRYRDPGWDLDWDFKWERGHTLNTLTKTKFDISSDKQLNPKADIPKAVKRVHEIFEKPTFMENILPGDIKQGNLGDCWLMASLTALANVPDAIRRMCVEYDTKIGIYGFVFYRDGEWIYSIIDDKLFLTSPSWDSLSWQRQLLSQIDREDVEQVYRKTYQTGSSALFFAANKDQNETWLPLIEKAFAKAHGDYAALEGGWTGEAIEDVSGGVTTELLASDIFDVDAFWENELSKVNQEFLFGCSTGLLDNGYGARNGITEGHAYVLMDARQLKDGTRLCKLRNPWGKIRKGNWEGAWSDGSKEWTTEAQEELNHTFGSDSTFWIPYEDLLRKYQHFDRTRLFRDPDWRACQRWIGVEVPWKSQYHEKFHIKLTKESPVVLVLSQLDDRYFRGLEGQYDFMLQFRLHEAGKPGSEEYIVRSHGNYLMDRSVSVEVPTLSPGNYAVYIAISAIRYPQRLSTEAVVRSQCQTREENEKLAQVGQAYDLAHSKAAVHLEKLFKVRGKADGKKASESRRKERRKNWEKRHIGRVILAKQKAKDAAKKTALKECKAAKAKAAAAEEAAKKEEAQAKTEQPKKPDTAVQTDPSTPKQDGGGQAEVNVSASTASASSSSAGTPECTPQVSPKTQVSAPVQAEAAKVAVPPAAQETVALADSATRTLELKVQVCSCDSCKKTTTAATTAAAKADESDGYSSSSPVEDYEDLYEEDDDEPTLKEAEKKDDAEKDKDKDSDDEDAPEPWNAIAVVGFRVYSKDEGLELRVVMEGGELEQDGMGTLGEADLDNAVANAAGEREKKKEEQGKGSDESASQVKIKGSSAEDPATKVADAVVAGQTTKSAGQDGEKPAPSDGKAGYRPIVERNTSEFDRVIGKAKTAKIQEEALSKFGGPLVEDAVSSPHNSVEQQPVEKKSSDAQEPAEDITKTVLSIRSKLQSACRNLLAQSQNPKDEDMQEMSDHLAKLEAYQDLEASVIVSTKIHKVMAAILRLNGLPKDEGFKFSIGSRAQALLDDYELTLMT